MSEYSSERISLSRSEQDLRRLGLHPEAWVADGIVPVQDGRWTRASAAQARVVSRMRERGYSLDAVRDAAHGGRLAFGYAEDLFEVPEGRYSVDETAEQAGLEPELIQRLMTLLGTPDGHRGPAERGGCPGDAPLRGGAGLRLSACGLPPARPRLRAVDPQVADAEVRLFHLYVHEPLMRDGVPPLEMAEEMGDLAADLLPVTSPLMEYMHNRYLRFYIEQDVVGHMESDVGGGGTRPGPGLDGVLLRRPHRLHPLHGGGGGRGGSRPGRALRRHRRGDPAGGGPDREDDRRRGDGGLARPGDLDGVGGRLPPSLPGASPAAGRPPLRRSGLSRRRLLRRRRQPRPPGRQPRARGRGHGHRVGHEAVRTQSTSASSRSARSS